MRVLLSGNIKKTGKLWLVTITVIALLSLLCCDGTNNATDINLDTASSSDDTGEGDVQRASCVGKAQADAACYSIQTAVNSACEKYGAVGARGQYDIYKICDEINAQIYELMF